MEPNVKWVVTKETKTVAKVYFKSKSTIHQIMYDENEMFFIKVETYHIISFPFIIPQPIPKKLIFHLIIMRVYLFILNLRFHYVFLSLTYRLKHQNKNHCRTWSWCWYPLTVITHYIFIKTTILITKFKVLHIHQLTPASIYIVHFCYYSPYKI